MSNIPGNHPWKNPWVRVTFFTIPKERSQSQNCHPLYTPWNLTWNLKSEVPGISEIPGFGNHHFQGSSRSIYGGVKIPIGFLVAGRPCKGKRSPTADWLHSRHPSAFRFGIWRSWGNLPVLHRIHETGIFNYKDGMDDGFFIVNIPYMDGMGKGWCQRRRR